MHTAADIYSRHVDYLGDCEWDFSRANGTEPPAEYRQAVDQYLAQIRDTPEPK